MLNQIHWKNGKKVLRKFFCHLYCWSSKFHFLGWIFVDFLSQQIKLSIKFCVPNANWILLDTFFEIFLALFGHVPNMVLKNQLLSQMCPIRKFGIGVCLSILPFLNEITNNCTVYITLMYNFCDYICTYRAFTTTYVLIPIPRPPPPNSKHCNN